MRELREAHTMYMYTWEGLISGGAYKGQLIKSYWPVKYFESFDILVTLKQ